MTMNSCACGCGELTPRTYKRGHVQRVRFADIATRIYARVTKTATCWLWDGPVDADGYPCIRYKGKNTHVHRVTWELANGPIPDGKVLRHVTCDNTRCIRPDHMEPGTQADNIADKVEKSRQAWGSNHGMARLEPADVLRIRRCSHDKTTRAAVAAQFGISPATVKAIQLRRIWKNLEGVA